MLRAVQQRLSQVKRPEMRRIVAGLELPPLVGATVRFGLNLEPVAADRNEDIAAKLGDLVCGFPA